MASSPRPEVWLRGPVPGVVPIAQPIVHALMQVLEDLDEKVPPLDAGRLWHRPGGAASVGFHLKHLAGSTDRLLTYARGEALTASQMAQLRAEKAGPHDETQAHLTAQVKAAIKGAIDQVRQTPPDAFFEPRAVGRAGLPSTVLGLLSHTAEHAARHMGQIITTAKIVQGLEAGEAA